MTCFHPIQGFQRLADFPSQKFNSSGLIRGPKLIFKEPDDHWNYKSLKVPCGRCRGCRLTRSRDWAIRCMHEASLHHDKCFITLTYDNENLPIDRSLNKRTFQLFMKRLRKHFSDRTIRYYHCGEYGDTYGRPHYHAILYGVDFYDKKFYKARGEHRLYQSETLASIWGLGYCSVGSVTFDSAAYVARYIMKKRLGSDNDHHYLRFDPDTGEVFYLTPEYNTMSRRPGIAADWIHKYSPEVYPDDFVVFKGKKFPPPKYYDKQFELIDPASFYTILCDREESAEDTAWNRTEERLEVREKVCIAKTQHLERTLPHYLVKEDLL